MTVTTSRSRSPPLPRCRRPCHAARTRRATTRHHHGRLRLRRIGSHLCAPLKDLPLPAPLHQPPLHRQPSKHQLVLRHLRPLQLRLVQRHLPLRRLVDAARPAPTAAHMALVPTAAPTRPTTAMTTEVPSLPCHLHLRCHRHLRHCPPRTRHHRPLRHLARHLLRPPRLPHRSQMRVGPTANRQADLPRSQPRASADRPRA